MRHYFQYSSLTLLLFCLLLLSVLVMPASAEVNLSVGGGYLAGETQYQIGGRTIDASGTTNLHFPISELNFPLDAFMVKGQVDASFKDRWSLMASAATNLTDDTGKMKDSDWGVVSSPDTLDIYSESDTEMDALLLEGKVAYVLYEGYYGQTAVNGDTADSDLRFSYTVGLGYKYQKFDFDISDLDQWYPSAPADPHDLVAGLVATYEAEYQIPYLEVGMVMNAADKFLLEISFAYAPLVDFQDEDQHLLRDKVSIADHDWNGTAAFINLKGRYKLTPRWHLGGTFEGLQIESEGRSNAYFGGVWDHSIEHEIESHQYSAFLSLGCSF